jgi:hypothetical protein
MGKQPELFASASISVRDKLLMNAKDGILFYSISQVSSLTKKTPYEIRYAVTTTYHLDALKLGEEYRVPFSAVLDYLDYLEIERGLDAASKEKDLDPARTALLLFLARKPAGKKPKGTKPYDLMPGKEEENPVDWYMLQRLPLPFSTSAIEWANILGVPGFLIEEVFNVSWKDPIQWPEMYDWLISCEVINLPVPFNLSEPVALLNEQLSLF